MAYYHRTDPNDIRWNEAQFFIERMSLIIDNILALLHDSNPENLKQLVIMLDSFLLETHSVIQYDKTKFEKEIMVIDMLIYRMDMNQDGRIDEEEAFRNRILIKQVRERARKLYSDMRVLANPYLGIDIQKVKKELRAMNYYKFIDKYIDKNIIMGMENVCPVCKNTFKNEQKAETEGVHEHSQGSSGV